MSTSDSIANANGQGPVTIMRSGGKEYILASLRMEDLGEVEQFAKELHRKETTKLIRDLGDLLSPEEKSQWLKDLRRELAGTIGKEDLDTGSWSWMMSIASPAVVAFAVVLRLRKTYPEMTEDEAKDIITAEAIANMEGDMSELVGLDAYGSPSDKEEAQGGAPSG